MSMREAFAKLRQLEDLVEQANDHMRATSRVTSERAHQKEAKNYYRVAVQGERAAKEMARIMAKCAAEAVEIQNEELPSMTKPGNRISVPRARRASRMSLRTGRHKSIGVG